LRYDVVIIGAGMSGLSAGVRLAHFGKKVAILERHYRVGGLNSFYRSGGYDLDVGLHAVTNYSPDGPKSAPMARLLRRLRMRMSDLELYPQKVSRIVFPDATLEFTNDFDHLARQSGKVFPGQEENLRRLKDEVFRLYENNFSGAPRSARRFASSFITAPDLVEMLMCPVMFYGSAWENDMEGGQFALLFMSLYCEGFARPKNGIRPILDLLVERFKNSGGEMRLRSGVQKIEVSKGKAVGVVLDNGDTVECEAVLSSAGLMETIAICPEVSPVDLAPEAGRMSFVESINIIDRPADELGLDASITFFSANRKFRYRRSDLPVDVQSGVICVPGNFCYDEPPDTHMVRITNIADPGFWEGADKAGYEKGKIEWRDKSLEVVGTIVPEFSDNVTYFDMFTPRTIRKFTGHINGAVYGSPTKLGDGKTPVENVFVCGTDQGYLGVVGSMISGVEIANQRLL